MRPTEPGHAAHAERPRAEPSRTAAFTRRALIKAALAASVAPAIFIPRRAKATPLDALRNRARHVLILNAAGGLRTAALFNADAATAHNPYGRALTPGASEWQPGALLEAPAFPLTTFSRAPAALPSAAALSGDIAILAGVDHQPGGPALVDHQQAAQALAAITTPEGTAGLLTLIHRHHAAYATKSVALPPIAIGASPFASATAAFAGHRPLELRSAEVLKGRSTSAAPATRASWMLDHQQQRDRRFADRHGPDLQRELDARSAAKLAARSYGAQLRNPALDLLAAPDAELGGLTNHQLLEALGAVAPSTSRWGLETAFALRCFQLGIPAATVTRELFDTHSDERDTFPEDAADLARQISGIHFLLHQLRDENNIPLWDSTVVLVVSEFGRDNTDPLTGFNFGGGSDHRGTPASRNQCWPIFGGPLAKRGCRIGRLDPETLQTIDRPSIPVGAVMATVLALLGIDPAPHYSHPPLVELFA